MQKVGYYKLTRPKCIANDWMVILDASIQMGDQKCLLAIGCRLANFPKNRPLTLQDFEILALRVVPSVNAIVIAQVLHDVMISVGKIICICTDRGSEMRCGVKAFQVSSPETKHIGDTAHRVANFLEATLEKSKCWKNFRDGVTQGRRKMQNSLVAGALPPSPRIKSRYMNVDSLIKWALDMLILLDNGISTPEFNIGELRKYLNWLLDYRDDINYWNKLVLIGASARQLVRVEGMHRDILDHFEQDISSIPMGFRELEFADKISVFLLEESQKLNPGERFIGSTESLESLFGKVKQMEHEQTAFGFTSLLLAAMACVGPTDEKTVEDAIRSIKLMDIDNWAEKEVGKSVQSQRRTIRRMVKQIIVRMEQEVSGISERKVVGF